MINKTSAQLELTMSSVFKFDRKILILGSTKHNGDVDCYAWEDSSLRNVDMNQYHTFLLNLHSIQINNIDEDKVNTVSLHSKKLDSITSMGSISKETILNLDFINRQLMYRREKDASSVILLINPKNKFTDSLFNHRILVSESFCSANNIKFRKLSKDRIGSQGQFVQLYFDLINSQLFSVKLDESISMINPSDVVKTYFDVYDNFDFIIESIHRVTPLAHTFYNATLSFIVTVEDVDFYILPHPNLVAPYDVVETIIRSIFQIQDEMNLVKPRWIETYNTRRQQVIKSEIDELVQQIQFLNQQIKEKEIEFELHEQFQQVLFTTGSVLTKSVQNLFQVMNFEIRELDDQHPHDIEIITSSGTIIGQVYHLKDDILDRAPFRTLNQWVETKEEILEFASKVKGLLIITFDVGRNPKEKRIPEMENPALLYAKRHNFAILTVEQLFTAYSIISEHGLLTKEEFVKLLVENSGFIEDNRLSIDIF